MAELTSTWEHLLIILHLMIPIHSCGRPSSASQRGKLKEQKVGISPSIFKFLTHKLNSLRGKSISSDYFGTPHRHFPKCSQLTNTNHSCSRFLIQQHAFKLHEKAISRFHKTA